MTERLIVTNANPDEIIKSIISRVDGCETSGHWIVRDPKITNRYLWLSKHDVTPLESRRHKGRLVLIKRILYAFDRKGTTDGDFVPKKNIKNACGEEWCVNPAHNYIPGYEPTKEQIKIWIEKKKPYLTKEDSERYWKWISMK